MGVGRFTGAAEQAPYPARFFEAPLRHVSDLLLQDRYLLHFCEIGTLTRSPVLK
jgi:hypothetical protein